MQTNVNLQAGSQQVLDAILRDRTAYIEQVSSDRPEDVEGGSVIPVLDPGTDIERDEEGKIDIPFTFHWLQEVHRRWPKSSLEQLREVHEYIPFQKPDLRIHRTPGQKAIGFEIPIVVGNKLQALQCFHPDEPEPEGIRLCNYYGWMLPHLIKVELQMVGRWRYWEETSRNSAPLNAPIPALKFLAEPNARTVEFLEYCLDYISPDWRHDSEEKWKAVNWFIDWLLWSLGHSSVPDFPVDQWDGRTHDKLFQVFDPTLFLLFPHDYFGYLLEQFSDETYSIPPQITMADANRLARSLFPNAKTKRGNGFQKNIDYRQQTLVIPEAGTGRLQMAASNACLRIISLNTDPLLAKIALLNGYFYDPGFIFPHAFLEQELTAVQLRDCLGRTLTIAREQGLDHYFERTELAPWSDRAKLMPVVLRRWRPTELELPEVELPRSPLDISQIKVAQIEEVAQPLTLPALSMANEELAPAIAPAPLTLPSLQAPTPRLALPETGESDHD